MTPDLAELRRLADEGTAPCEHTIHRNEGVFWITCSTGGELARVVLRSDDPEGVVQQFMALTMAEHRAALLSSAVPALCDEVDRLRGLLDRCERVLGDLERNFRPSPAAAYDERLDTMTVPMREARAVLAELRAAPADETKG